MSDPLPPERVAELKAIAEKMYADDDTVSDNYWIAFTEAFNQETVLALLAEVERLTKELGEWKQRAEAAEDVLRQADIAVEAAEAERDAALSRVQGLEADLADVDAALDHCGTPEIAPGTGSARLSRRGRIELALMIQGGGE